MHFQRNARIRALLATTALAPVVLAAPALAQDPVTEVDEIVITGIRASQEQAIDIKRETTAIVDAISAEDIGKLPDVTVADALQRIAGIQVQRSAGEGATVNIRSLPQVVTLLNGEQYLSPGNLGSAQPNLNDVPAQLMNSLVVFKSMDPRNALSGISGTIDLRTRRPFDFDDGLTISTTAEYATGERTREDDYLFSGLANWRNDRFGVMLAGVTSESNLGNNYSGIAGGLFGNNDWGGDGVNWIAPHGYESFNRVVERQRTGVNGAFQWDIEDGVTLTAEVFYTKQEEYNRAAGLNISNRWSALGWTTPTEFEQTGVNGGNGSPWLNVSEYDLDVWWLNSFTVNRATENESTNYNLEFEYDKGGPFRWSARAIHANAELLSMNGQVQGDLSNWQATPGRQFTLFRDPADPTRGPFYPANIAAMYPGQYSNGVVGSNGGRYVDPNPLGIGEDPLVHLDIGGSKAIWSQFDNPISGGLGAGHTLQDYMANLDSYAVAAFSSEGNQNNNSTLDVVRADGSYDFDEPFLGFVTRFDIGGRFSRRAVEIENFHLFSDFYGGNGATDPNGCSAQWKAIDVVMNQNQCQAGEFVSNSAFDPTLPVATAPGDCSALPDARANAPTCFQGYTVNRPTKLDEHTDVYFLDDYGSITQGLPGVWVADPRAFDDVVAFQERVFGNAYRVIIPGNSYQVTLEERSFYLNSGVEFGKLTGDIGLKVIRTDLKVRQNLTGETRNYGDTNLDIGDTYARRAYYDYLPSVNLAYDFNDRLRARFGYSKTMIPLDLGNYGGGLTIQTADSPGPSPDNPNASPIGVRQVTGANSSGNPDLNPWRSDNYDVSLEYYLGRGTLFNVALFRLNIDSFVTGGTTEGRFPDQDGVIRRTVPVTQPIQGDGGELQGIEVGAKVALNDFLMDGGFWSDFGFDGSFTYSDSSQNAQNLSGDDLPFQDNSKYSYNAAVWYQSDRLQARVAYNFRTPRLSGVFSGIPIYQDTAQYVDVNVTYDVTDDISVYFNGSNVLGEIEEYYVEFEEGSEQFHSRNQFEPRYSVGIRARF